MPDMTKTTIAWTSEGNILVPGQALGDVLFSDVPLSFWGGIDARTGEVIDRNHPLFGENVAGRILAIPSGRGSCTGSSVIMELVLNGHGPSGMLFSQREDILTLGVVVADEMFGHSIPMVELRPDRFAALKTIKRVSIDNARVEEQTGTSDLVVRGTHSASNRPASTTTLSLGQEDQRMLDGEQSRARQIAMRIIVRMAGILDASTLIDITQAHIDGCIYTGEASLKFAEMLCASGAEVKVPTTLNAISVDRHNWRQQGTDPALGEPASALADAYLRMGAKPSFTCAPYQLDSAPGRGEDIVWAESNAVVYANSVLGARTMKYPDYLDICIALTGRAPLAGCHVDANRRATVRITVPPFSEIDDSFYPLLGYQVGLLAQSRIPVVTGLETLSPSPDDLKAFGAAFGTTSGAPMFHIVGITPEAASLDEATGGVKDIETLAIGKADLVDSWHRLTSAFDLSVDLVSLGNPHFSANEFERLAGLLRGRARSPDVRVVVTTSRMTQAEIIRRGLEPVLREFGVQIVVDACWCMVVEPVIPPTARTIMTNSGKYAHYGPGLSGRTLHFGSLSDCVDAACTGRASGRLPAWLTRD